MAMIRAMEMKEVENGERCGYGMARVLIYGAGAIGSMVGYLLGQPTEPDDRKIETVALLGRATHMQKIIESGLR